MPYAPRQKRKMPWIIVIVSLVFVVGITSMILFKMNQGENQEEKKYQVCHLSEVETLKALNQSSSEKFVLSDYLYYGESLDLYEKTYSPENEDTLSGKTIELKNICDESKSVSMTMENTIDQKVLLDELQPGYYEVYIIDNLVSKRIVWNKPLEKNEFYTVKRDNKIRKIELIADQNLLKDYDVTLDDHYLFIQVSEVENNDEIDVLIDPYGMNQDLTWLPDSGYEANGLIENDEMYDAAVMMKKELEEVYGLRVAISKKSKDEVGKAYGEEGRLAEGYDRHAKYYLHLRFNYHDNDTIKGFGVAHSNHASKILARQITYQMKKNLKMNLTPLYYGDEEGIITTLLGEGKDGKNIYDLNLHIRESGGRATQCAKYSDVAASENKEFENADGMNALEILFGYISNKEDASNWKKNKKKIVKEVADAFAQGINVEPIK